MGYVFDVGVDVFTPAVTTATTLLPPFIRGVVRKDGGDQIPWWQRIRRLKGTLTGFVHHRTWIVSMSTLTLAELLQSVKPRARTQRFKLLAASYFLNAFEQPVAVSTIREALALPLGNATPQDISRALRDYPADFEVAAKGPPVRWRLTKRGLQRLRETTGLDLPTETHDLAFLSDVGFVCALEVPEFTALRDAVGIGTWKELHDPGTPLRFKEATISTGEGQQLRLVATTSMAMGLTCAAIATTQLVLRFRPRLVVMVGIAAGTRDGGKQFGDVLVADPSVDYNSGKVVDAHGIREFQPDPYPIGLNARLRSLLQKYLGSNRDIFSDIRSRWRHDLPATGNRLHLGPLGAADQVIDDPSRVLEIQGNWRKLIGVEMETYAVYRACHDAPEPKPRFVSFKSVCDFAANKGDSWQAYAAFTSAEFAIEFIKREWRNLWPQSGVSDVK